MSPGVWTIFHGEVTASFSGMPDGRQKLLGSSFPRCPCALCTRLGPGLEGDFLQVRRDIDQVFEPGDQPDSTQVRLAIGKSRRGRGRSALPSFVRGIPGVFIFSHCAEAAGIRDSRAIPNIEWSRRFFMCP